MKKKLIILTLILALLIIIIAAPAQASPFGASLNQTIAETGQASSTNLFSILAMIVQALLGLLGLVFVVLIIYAGSLYMLSAGEPKKIETAKNIIKAAIIGLIIVICSYSIAYFVTYVVESASKTT